MNAYELADYLEVSPNMTVFKAAAMLRQQQAEIKALKKLVSEMKYEKSRGVYEMNNVPVAWMSQGGDVSRSADYFEEMGFTDLIPLYTHPVKELTDEEITKLHLECWDEIEFARAILRKASEK
jgi:cyanate lyase